MHSDLVNMSPSVSGVSWMLSFTGDRGFLQEGSFSESLQNRREENEFGVFRRVIIREYSTWMK